MTTDELQFVKLPEPLSKLYKLVDEAKKKPSRLSSKELGDAVEKAVEYLRGRSRDLFGKTKTYTDECIAEIVFEYFYTSSQFNQYLRCSWQGITQSLIRVSENIKTGLSKPEVSSSRQASDAAFLWDAVFDLIVFVSYAEMMLGYKGYGFGKRGLANSTEVFLASIDHLRHIHGDDSLGGEFITQPTSAVLLRQAIELRLSRALGIRAVIGAKGFPVKLPPEVFLDFVCDNRHVTVPVKTSLIRKIHKWTNYYIHGGWIPEVWKIEFAQHLLRELFTSGESGRTWSYHGAIRIDKKYFNGGMQEDLKTLIEKKMKAKRADGLLLAIKKLFAREVKSSTPFVIDRINPEALLV